MSDTDDGFDEEAVRRELREKYEDDDRGETERMSELLLQGATMTNQHCDHCGTPIFRYEGQAFCPNCQHEYEQQQAQGGQGTPSEGAQEAREQAQGGQEPAVQGDQTGTVAGGEASDPAQQATSGNDSGAEHATPGGREPDQGRASPERSQPPARPQHDDLPQTATAASSEATDALESSIAALARRAAGSDDPRTAREYLEAAREAAEALAALRRTE